MWNDQSLFISSQNVGSIANVPNTSYILKHFLALILLKSLKAAVNDSYSLKRRNVQKIAFSVGLGFIT